MWPVACGEAVGRRPAISQASWWENGLVIVIMHPSPSGVLHAHSRGEIAVFESRCTILVIPPTPYTYVRMHARTRARARAHTHTHTLLLSDRWRVLTERSFNKTRHHQTKDLISNIQSSKNNSFRSFMIFFTAILKTFFYFFIYISVF